MSPPGSTTVIGSIDGSWQRMDRVMLILVASHQVAQGIEVQLLAVVESFLGEQTVNNCLGISEMLVRASRRPWERQHKLQVGITSLALESGGNRSSHALTSFSFHSLRSSCRRLCWFGRRRAFLLERTGKFDVRQVSTAARSRGFAGRAGCRACYTLPGAGRAACGF